MLSDQGVYIIFIIIIPHLIIISIVFLRDKTKTMLNRSPDDSTGVESEVAKLLHWASEKDIIERNQYTM